MFDSCGITCSNCVLFTGGHGDRHISHDANMLVLPASKKYSTYFYFYTSEEVLMSFRIFPFVLSDMVSAKPRRKPVPPDLSRFSVII